MPIAALQLVDSNGQFAPEPRAAWGRSSTAAWLIAHDGRMLPGGELFERLCLELVAEGVPLLRASCGLLAMHPQTFARNLLWKRGERGSEFSRAYGIQNTEAYRNSPVYLIHQGAAAVRRRLDLPDALLDFTILRELKDIGASDYVCMPVRFTNGHTNYVSWATDRPGGFSTEHLSLLWDLLPLIALRFEVESGQVATRDLLNTYLGRNAAAQVLAGIMRQGQGSRLDAVIWYCDLRGFTAMADREPPEKVIATLDQYFDCMVAAVHGHGGEVLKFVGDGMLAIFPLGPGKEREVAGRALAASSGAFRELDRLNARRLAESDAPLRVGIALHRGIVTYGNIGGGDRLDFTVIGHAVNEVCRVEDLCPKLGRPLLATAAFQELAPDAGLESVGVHALRGVKEPEELFAWPYTGDI